MADVNKWLTNPSGRRYKRIHNEPFVNRVTWDRGNYINGFLVGTIRSITPVVWVSYYNLQGPQTDAQAQALYKEMYNAPLSKFYAIYEAKYWNALKLDTLENQVIAEMIADFASSAGQYRAASIVNSLFGFGTSNKVEVQTISYLNQQHRAGQAQVVYKKLYDRLFAYYNGLSRREHFLKNLNKYYPPDRNAYEQGGGNSATYYAALALVGGFAFLKILKFF